MSELQLLQVTAGPVYHHIPTGNPGAFYKVSEPISPSIHDRCEAITARRTRCRAGATWSVYQDGADRPHRSCARHLNNHKRGWW
jgi:hypothetical protein